MLTSTGHTHRPASERGSAVLIVLVLISILSVVVSANILSVNVLDQQIKQIDQRQQQYWKNLSNTKPAASVGQQRVAQSP